MTPAAEPKNLSARRSTAALTRCRRWALADGRPLAGRPTPGLLRALRRHDRALELYWHPRRQRWILYRVVHRAGAPSEDILLKEFELTGPNDEYRAPGWWLIEWLQRNDVTRGGSLDQGRATKAYIRDLMRANDDVEERQAAERADLSWDFAKNVGTYVVDERRHFDMKRDRCKKDSRTGSRRTGSKSPASSSS